MRDHLVFTLTATFGAMGDLAGHERRGSWTWPGRSAIIGLLAAAKGIRRDGDFTALDALSVSVAIFDAGAPLRDYHTVQTVPTAKVKRPQSRPSALRDVGDDVNTTITLRDYRLCPLYGVALTGDGLEDLQNALLEPVFTLYLGRKSCTLASPMGPKIVRATDAAAALAHITLPPWWPTEKAIATQLLSGGEPSAPGVMETRHDAPLDRRLWHFSERRFHRQIVRIAPLEAAH